MLIQGVIKEYLNEVYKNRKTVFRNANGLTKGCELTMLNALVSMLKPSCDKLDKTEH